MEKLLTKKGNKACCLEALAKSHNDMHSIAKCDFFQLLPHLYAVQHLEMYSEHFWDDNYMDM